MAAGLGATGRVVTAAAILLAVAIGAFSTSSISFIQQIGVATATGVLLDAFIVRSLLVPSLMALLGRWNWWSPRPLRRLRAADRTGGAAAGGRRDRMIGGTVATRAARSPLVIDWLPVLVLPPVLVIDAALSVRGKPIDVVNVLAAIVGCCRWCCGAGCRSRRSRRCSSAASC